MQWFTPAEALDARAAGEIELAPPQYVTLLELRAHATVEDALAAIAAAESFDFTPRFHFSDAHGAICVYADDVAYHDLGQLDADGPRHRLYLRDTGWEYIRS